MRIVFLVNRKIRGFKSVKKQIDEVFAGCDFEIEVSTRPQHFLNLPKQLFHETTHFIAVGGDGTINECINGLLKHFTDENGNTDWDSVASLKFGVYSKGSGNDFVKNISSNSLHEIKNNILMDKGQCIDVGEAYFHDKDGMKQRRFFINIADVGLGAVVVENMLSFPKFLGASLNYFWNITKGFLTYQKKQVHASWQEHKWHGAMMNFAIANGKYFGHGLGIAPDAVLDDGKFHVTIIGNVSFLDYLKNLWKVKSAKKIDHPQVFYYETHHIYIDAENLVAVEMDGEFTGYCPLEIFNRRQKLFLIGV